MIIDLTYDVKFINRLFNVSTVQADLAIHKKKVEVVAEWLAQNSENITKVCQATTLILDFSVFVVLCKNTKSIKNVARCRIVDLNIKSVVYESETWKTTKRINN